MKKATTASRLKTTKKATTDQEWSGQEDGRNQKGCKHQIKTHFSRFVENRPKSAGIHIVG